MLSLIKIGLRLKLGSTIRQRQVPRLTEASGLVKLTISHCFEHCEKCVLPDPTWNIKGSPNTNCCDLVAKQF